MKPFLIASRWALATSLVLSTWGCGSSINRAADAGPDDTTPDTGSIQSKTDAGPDTGTDTGADTRAPDSGSDAGDDSDVPDPDLTCMDRATQADCNSCCEQMHPDQATLFRNMRYACECRFENCQEDCSNSFCAASPINPDPGDNCSTCLYGDPTDPGTTTTEDFCTTDALETCLEDPNCAKYYDCTQTAECATK